MAANAIDLLDDYNFHLMIKIFEYERDPEMVEKIISLVGSGRPQFGQITYRNGENMALYADISKARQLLNWAARTDLQQGLKQTIKWMIKHGQ